MSESQSKVFMSPSNDPEMELAQNKACKTFRYFWREMFWERQRIIPGLDLAYIKASFFDIDRNTATRSSPEYMWIGEVDFDGYFVSGILLNSPNWLKSIKAGDAVQIRLDEISDWMYAINAEVYGAYTVNLLRSRMSQQECQEHDGAWDLNFGDPHQIRIVLGQTIFGEDVEILEHPMSENRAEPLSTELIADPSMLSRQDDRGWTLLHHHALAGNTANVKILLDRGANINTVTNQGVTPLQLAESLGWDKVIALLNGKST
jgi:uncharacterized protein